MLRYLFSVSNLGLLFFHVGPQAAQRRIGSRNIGHRTLPKILVGTFLVRGHDFELILMVKMETRHPLEGYFSSEFRAICNHCGVWRPEVARPGNLSNFWNFLEKRPLTLKFSKFCSERFHRLTDRRCCIQIS